MSQFPLNFSLALNITVLSYLSTDLFTVSKAFFFKMIGCKTLQDSQTLQSVTVVSVLEQEKKKRGERGKRGKLELKTARGMYI